MTPEPRHQQPDLAIPTPADKLDPALALGPFSLMTLPEDARAKLEVQDLDLRRREEEITSLVQDREQRLLSGNKVFRLVIGWLLFVGLTLIFVAIRSFALSDAVLVALLGTTTVSVVGLLATVALYLFPKR